MKSATRKPNYKTTITFENDHIRRRPYVQHLHLIAIDKSPITSEYILKPLKTPHIISLNILI